MRILREGQAPGAGWGFRVVRLTSWFWEHGLGRPGLLGFILRLCSHLEALRDEGWWLPGAEEGDPVWRDGQLTPT